MKLLRLSIFLIMLVACGEKSTTSATNDDASSSSGGSSTTFGASSSTGSSVVTKGIMTDKDGKSYPTVTIGGQTWMAKNLAWLPFVNAKSDSSIIAAKYYVYDYDGTNVAAAKSESHYTKYGVLYNYQAALTACPDGWHLPSDEEWTTLETYIDSTGTIAGTKLKAASDWYTGGTDDYDFSALPGGLFYNGAFFEVGKWGYWWTATAAGTSNAWNRGLSAPNNAVYEDANSQGFGFSVRCLKDSN